MDIKNAIGIANVLAIFSELSKEAKDEIITDLVSSGELPNMQWQDAARNKPEKWIPVFAKGGFNKEPIGRMVVWTNNGWHYYNSVEEVDSVSHFCLP